MNINKLINIHHLFLLLFIFTQFPVLSRCCHDHERNALLTFKSFLGDPSNRLSSWQVGSQRNCCNWDGIQCSQDSFHVISVDLRNRNLRESLQGFQPDSTPSSTALNGTISPSLFNLTHLQYLDLSFNDFQYSQIPHQFSNLQKLTHLNLSNSYFSGSITTQFANLSSLRYLDISCIFYISVINEVYGFGYLKTSTTNWVRGLVNLKVLRLSGVDLSVASSTNKQNWAEPISFLADLRELDLSRCDIYGTIPINEFLNLSRLSSLKMNSNYNFRYSPIPIQLANNLTSLSVLDLSACNLQGSVPYLPQLKELQVSENQNLTVDLTWMFEHQWPKLQTLSISSTHVIGSSIPSSVSNTSTSLVNLSQLQFLDLSFNDLTGHLPSSILKLSQLQFLDLSYNDLTGHLPSSILKLSQLQFLDLSFNDLTGHLPSSISNLKNLQSLELFGNKFQGSIPDSICEISSLQRLDLGSNNLSGTIPSCITKLRNLYNFNVAENSIGGNISLISLINKLNLTRLNLNSNRITVETDQQLFPSKFHQLNYLQLQSCNLKGYIPVFICDLTHLYRLDLSHNNLTGPIPSCLFKLPTIADIDLSRNNLQGIIPHSALQYNQRSMFLNLSSNNLHGPLPLPPQKAFLFDLSQNNFTGGITIETGERLSTASYVSLSGNKLSGSIPSSICSSSLESLDLSNNQLTGTIPSSLGYCNHLISLQLSKNNLTGNVPNELERANSIRYLQLNDNALNGSFPNCIKQLTDLKVLNLGNNNFGGSIPTFVGSLGHLQILSLRSNTFNGSIPEEITYLQKLHILDFSRNNFSGPIPRNIGNLKRLKSRPNDTFALGRDKGIFDVQLQMQMVIKGIMRHFERLYNYNSGIDLSCNILEGNIPEGMGLLKGLVMLSLSHNRFSGKIPASVGYMTALESLDLSFNRLSGEIPQSLTSIDYLGYLNLSYNSLSGRIPRGSHFETLSVDGLAYFGNPLLCGVPTKKRCKGDPIPSGSTDDPISILKDDEDDQEDAREKWLFYGIVALGFIVGFWGLFFVLLLRKEKWWFGYWRVVDTVVARILGCIRKK